MYFVLIFVNTSWMFEIYLRKSLNMRSDVNFALQCTIDEVFVSLCPFILVIRGHVS